MKAASSIPGVKKILGICSGKGGVGKSTVACNLAIAFASQGKTVGLLDADIYGPSQPTLMGLEGVPEISASRKMIPLENYGVKVMSMGFVMPATQRPAVWRGPLASSALQQLVRDTAWGEPDLDVLVVDLPPGTGDVHLTLAQSVPLSGCVVVSTPQEMALLSALKGMTMFEQVGVRVLGLVENMSHLDCGCGERHYVFGRHVARERAADLELPFLGEIPIATAPASGPVMAMEPHSSMGEVYASVATQVLEALEQEQVATPNIVIED